MYVCIYITFSCRANAGSACRSVTRKIPDRRAKKENGAGGSKVREPRAAGTQFTCFTVTKLQILTQQQRRTAGGGLSHGHASQAASKAGGGLSHGHASQAASRTSSEAHFPEMLPVGKRGLVSVRALVRTRGLVRAAACFSSGDRF
jgi:hypothetical protein